MSHPPAFDASPWVSRWLGGLAPGSRVLDFASGGGRHALLAQSLGMRVLAVDRDAQALEPLAGQGVETRVLDLEAGRWQLPPGAFDAIVVANYLFRPRYALLCALLAPGGLLIHETFARGNEAFGKPSNPDFLLREGELLERAAAGGLIVLGYESGYATRPKPAIVQRICAARPPLPRDGIALG
ncbi:MAG TPA: SAM-dependent methyltransferase [Burkholderiaceae bacterium]|nr:SAM-dependent methyltransferase [Burkholderiaceae bacterium]